MQAAADFGMKKVAIAGGVASNGALRTAMEKACTERGYKFYRPSPIFCTDNAAMDRCGQLTMNISGEHATAGI